MNREKIVRDVGRSLNLLDPSGELKQLDSICTIDLVLDIEKAMEVKIPSAFMRPEVFPNIESTTHMLAQLPSTAEGRK